MVGAPVKVYAPSGPSTGTLPVIAPEVELEPPVCTNSPPLVVEDDPAAAAAAKDIAAALSHGTVTVTVQDEAPVLPGAAQQNFVPASLALTQAEGTEDVVFW